MLRNHTGLLVLLIFGVLCLFSLPAHSDQHASEESPYHKDVKLLILGDSLSAAYGLKAEQGWVNVLQTRFNNEQLPIEIINAAISGETTDGGLSRLPRLLEQHAPTHVLIELGGNDGLQGHPVNKIAENLTLMIAKIRHADAQPLLQDMQIPTNYGRRYTEMFSNVFEKVASANNVPLIPFFIQDIALEPELMQRDGIHPNAKAQPLIAGFMHKQLVSLLL